MVIKSLSFVNIDTNCTKQVLWKKDQQIYVISGNFFKSFSGFNQLRFCIFQFSILIQFLILPSPQSKLHKNIHMQPHFWVEI